ncbi:MAG: 16S rRNA (guanine(527)-N(7))-methyltransferase RsmG [Clostridiales bacterium]|nr:16S rRNA (guanine(527)-N(7))-methyltransferase RsmG [Clostridiales bacterium]
MSIFTETMKDLCPGLEDGQLSAMADHHAFLVKNNKQFNLTAIIDERDAAFKHFYDSIFCEDLIPRGADVLDVGAGAGFPGIPLKIVRPDIRLTLLDAAAKKADFMQKAAQAVGAEVRVVNARAEEAAHKEMRGSFDACVSRAVAPLDMLLELCLPYVRMGGIFLAYKGEYSEELSRAQNALAQLGGAFERAVRGGGGCNHNVLLIKKTGETPQKYPRRYARILKNPL